MQRSVDVAYGEATLRTHPSSGQATVDSALIAKSPCLPLRGSTRLTADQCQLVFVPMVALALTLSGTRH
jgi:hypothetical protein